MRIHETVSERQRVTDAICLQPDESLNSSYRFVYYAGILPYFYPDGTRIALLSDMHIPAHHKLLIWPVKKFLSDFKPHVLKFCGDALDVFALSRFPKPALARVVPAEEFSEGREVLDDIITTADPYWTFVVLGNHEERIQRYLSLFAPHFARMVDWRAREQMLSFHHLLGYTDKDRITFVAGRGNSGGYEGGILMNRDVLLEHGIKVKGIPGQSAQTDAEAYGRSVVHGHTHRLGSYARYTPRLIVRGYELGNLVNPFHSYFNYAPMNNWHPGFAVAHVRNGLVHIETIPFLPITVKGRTKLGFRYGGNLYMQADR